MFIRSVIRFTQRQGSKPLDFDYKDVLKKIIFNLNIYFNLSFNYIFFINILICYYISFFLTSKTIFKQIDWEELSMLETNLRKRKYSNQTNHVQRWMHSLKFILVNNVYPSEFRSFAFSHSSNQSVNLQN